MYMRPKETVTRSIECGSNLDMSFISRTENATLPSNPAAPMLQAEWWGMTYIGVF